MRVHLSLLVVVATSLTSISVGAQVRKYDASLTIVEGTVLVNDVAVAPNDVKSDLPATAVVRTTEGRAAIGLRHGGWLFLDAGASVRVLANGIYNFNQIEVLSGSAIIASETSSPVVECGSPFRLSDAGIFRIDAKAALPNGERPCRFRVYEGAAAVPLSSITGALRRGQTMTCYRKCHDMLPVDDFPLDQLDAFDQWARQTRESLGR